MESMIINEPAKKDSSLLIFEKLPQLSDSLGSKSSWGAIIIVQSGPVHCFIARVEGFVYVLRCRRFMERG